MLFTETLTKLNVLQFITALGSKTCNCTKLAQSVVAIIEKIIAILDFPNKNTHSLENEYFINSQVSSTATVSSSGCWSISTANIPFCIPNKKTLAQIKKDFARETINLDGHYYQAKSDNDERILADITYMLTSKYDFSQTAATYASQYIISLASRTLTGGESFKAAQMILPFQNAILQPLPTSSTSHISFPDNQNYTSKMSLSEAQEQLGIFSLGDNNNTAKVLDIPELTAVKQTRSSQKPSISVTVESTFSINSPDIQNIQYKSFAALKKFKVPSLGQIKTFLHIHLEISKLKIAFSSHDTDSVQKLHFAQDSHTSLNYQNNIYNNVYENDTNSMIDNYNISHLHDITYDSNSQYNKEGCISFADDSKNILASYNSNNNRSKISNITSSLITSTVASTQAILSTIQKSDEVVTNAVFSQIKEFRQSVIEYPFAEFKLLKYQYKKYFSHWLYIPSNALHDFLAIIDIFSRCESISSESCLSFIEMQKLIIENNKNDLVVEKKDINVDKYFYNKCNKIKNTTINENILSQSNSYVDKKKILNQCEYEEKKFDTDLRNDTIKINPHFNNMSRNLFNNDFIIENEKFMSTEYNSYIESNNIKMIFPVMEFTNYDKCRSLNTKLYSDDIGLFANFDFSFNDFTWESEIASEANTIHNNCTNETNNSNEKLITKKYFDNNVNDSNEQFTQQDEKDFFEWKQINTNEQSVNQILKQSNIYKKKNKVIESNNVNKKQDKQSSVSGNLFNMQGIKSFLSKHSGIQELPDEPANLINTVGSSLAAIAIKASGTIADEVTKRGIIPLANQVPTVSLSDYNISFDNLHNKLLQESAAAMNEFEYVQESSHPDFNTKPSINISTLCSSPQQIGQPTLLESPLTIATAPTRLTYENHIPHSIPVMTDREWTNKSQIFHNVPIRQPKNILGVWLSISIGPSTRLCSRALTEAISQISPEPIITSALNELDPYAINISFPSARIATEVLPLIRSLVFDGHTIVAEHCKDSSVNTLNRDYEVALHDYYNYRAKMNSKEDNTVKRAKARLR